MPATAMSGRSAENVVPAGPAAGMTASSQTEGGEPSPPIWRIRENSDTGPKSI